MIENAEHAEPRTEIGTRTQTRTQTLSGHPALARVSPEVVAARQACYGRQWPPIVCGGQTLSVSFEDITASQAEMQWRVRVDGFDFELQFVEPAALFELGSALAPGVPLALQRAAVLHAAGQVLQALEAQIGSRIDLVGLSGAAPVWPGQRALGAVVSRMGGSGGSGGAGIPNAPTASNGANPQARRCAVTLRALQPEGWQRLERAARRLPAAPPAHDCRLDLALHAQPIPLTLAELARIEPGDLLLMRAPATELGRASVALKLGRHTLPHVFGSLAAGVLTIARPADSASWPDPSHEFRSTRMTSQTTARTEPPGQHHDASNVRRDAAPGDAGHAAAGQAGGGQVDAVQVDALEVEIELELGRLSMPLSAVRTLAVGQVFETRHAVDGDGVVLWCGGQRLGIGRLVAVGERLAVHVSSLAPSSLASSSLAPSALGPSALDHIATLAAEAAAGTPPVC